MKSLDKLFEIQKQFSELFRPKEELSVQERERLTQEFALALHSEVSAIIREINFKSHEQKRKQIVENSILFETFVQRFHCNIEQHAQRFVFLQLVGLSLVGIQIEYNSLLSWEEKSRERKPWGN